MMMMMVGCCTLYVCVCVCCVCVAIMCGVLFFFVNCLDFVGAWDDGDDVHTCVHVYICVMLLFYVDMFDFVAWNDGDGEW